MQEDPAWSSAETRLSATMLEQLTAGGSNGQGGGAVLWRRSDPSEIEQAPRPLQPPAGNRAVRSSESQQPGETTQQQSRSSAGVASSGHDSHGAERSVRGTSDRDEARDDTPAQDWPAERSPEEPVITDKSHGAGMRQAASPGHITRPSQHAPPYQNSKLEGPTSHHISVNGSSFDGLSHAASASLQFPAKDAAEAAAPSEGSSGPESQDADTSGVQHLDPWQTPIGWHHGSSSPAGDQMTPSSALSPFQLQGLFIKRCNKLKPHRMGTRLVRRPL